MFALRFKYFLAACFCWSHAAQQRNQTLRGARAQRDAVPLLEIQRIWQAHLQVYGADKVWKQMNREGIYR
ncbi:hypothetical protein HF921_04810 [Acidithiobacillus ferriphilus]|nr:hypothetical protein [Acidithiobacillus ferriphilus]